MPSAPLPRLSSDYLRTIFVLHPAASMYILIHWITPHAGDFRNEERLVLFMKNVKMYLRQANLIFFASLISISILAVGLSKSPNSVFAAPAASGATLPYVEVQAEDAVTNGTIIGPDRFYPSLAAEAIGRQAVTLDAPGQYGKFTIPQDANSIVMRYSIPDSIDVLGLTAPLSLYIDGVQQTDLTLTSTYGWHSGSYPLNKNSSRIRGQPFLDGIHRPVGPMRAGDHSPVQRHAPATAP